MEASIGTSDLESEPTPPSFIDSTDDVDDEELSLSMGDEPSASIEPISQQPMKMMRSKRTGNYSIFYTVNRKPRIVDVPAGLTDFARENGPEATLDMINSMREDKMSDEYLMNELNRMIDNQ